MVSKQFCFRTKSSTAKANFNLISEILDAPNNKKKTVGSIFCDLEKALDCINHDILLPILEFYGIRGKINDLIKSYLINIHYGVLIERKDSFQSNVSNWGKVKHGVPQESILGPLFFLFYINDLPNIIKINSKPVIPADDTSIIITSPSPIDYKKIGNVRIK